MFNRFTLVIFCAAVLGAALAWVLSAPKMLPEQAIAQFPAGDAAAGEMVFWAGGCASCHARPKADDEEKLKLAGGAEFDTPFGVFVAPNISPDDEAGLGNWSLGDFANAMIHGVRPDGAHYYPAFPYPSYNKMSHKDVANLWAFLQSLPKVAEPAPAHRVGFRSTFAAHLDYGNCCLFVTKWW